MPRRPNAEPDRSPTFVRLELRRPSPQVVVEVGAARIVVEPGFDATLLRAVVDALGSGT